jgi:hypothetical protein
MSPLPVKIGARSTLEQNQRAAYSCFVTNNPFAMQFLMKIYANSA